LSIGMHWLMLLLMIGVYAAINLQDLAPKGSALRADLIAPHELTAGRVRLATRLVSGPAPTSSRLRWW
jgi:cytochrome b561